MKTWAEFVAPKGFHRKVRFHPIGVGTYRNPVRTQSGEGLICISPFLHEAAIATLRQNVPHNFWLFSRREELQRLKKDSLEGIAPFCLSSLIVDGESLSNGEDGDTEQLEQNLHAKVYVYKRNERVTTWFVGSANATRAAFERNVEFLLELRGSSDLVQFEVVLDDLLGPQRDIHIFEAFVPNAEAVDETAQKALDRRVRQLEFDLFSVLEIVQAELVKSENTRNFDLLLTLRPGGAEFSDLEVMLAPFNSDHKPQPLASVGQTSFRFENINEGNLSRFLCFEIYHNKVLQRAFLMKIDIAGMPAGRISKIIKGIISDRDKFFEYLRFLLADDFDKEAEDGTKGDESRSSEHDDGSSEWDVTSPIFEQLLVTASRRPARLKEIDGIIRQLVDGDEGEKKEIVPQQFLAVWECFRQMIPPTHEARP